MISEEEVRKVLESSGRKVERIWFDSESGDVSFQFDGSSMVYTITSDSVLYCDEGYPDETQRRSHDDYRVHGTYWKLFGKLIDRIKESHPTEQSEEQEPTLEEKVRDQVYAETDELLELTPGLAVILTNSMKRITIVTPGKVRMVFPGAHESGSDTPIKNYRKAGLSDRGKTYVAISDELRKHMAKANEPLPDPKDQRISELETQLDQANKDLDSYIKQHRELGKKHELLQRDRNHWKSESDRLCGEKAKLDEQLQGCVSPEDHEREMQEFESEVGELEGLASNLGSLVDMYRTLFEEAYSERESLREMLK